MYHVKSSQLCDLRDGPCDLRDGPFDRVASDELSWFSLVVPGCRGRLSRDPAGGGFSSEEGAWIRRDSKWCKSEDENEEYFPEPPQCVSLPISTFLLLSISTILLLFKQPRVDFSLIILHTSLKTAPLSLTLSLTVDFLLFFLFLTFSFLESKSFAFLLSSLNSLVKSYRSQASRFNRSNSQLTSFVTSFELFVTTFELFSDEMSWIDSNSITSSSTRFK